MCVDIQKSNIVLLVIFMAPIMAIFTMPFKFYNFIINKKINEIMAIV